MNVKFRWLPAMATAVLLALTGCGKQEAPKVAEKAAADVKAAVKAVESDAKELEAREIAIEAYIYAYPLVTMEYTRRVMSNTATPVGSKSPMGQFARLRSYPAVDDHSVTAPNADTLYTTAWLDLSKEPWILSIPDMKDRYFLFPMLDGWTNVFQVPGKRTTGTRHRIRDYGARIDWNAAGRRHRVQGSDQHGLAARPYLLHRHAGGLQGGACAAGPDLGRAAVVLWQAVHASVRHG